MGGRSFTTETDLTVGSERTVPITVLLASQLAIMGKVLGIVYGAISTYITGKASHRKGTVRTGAITVIQRFGSALNLNIYFQMLFLYGVMLRIKMDPLRVLK